MWVGRYIFVSMPLAVSNDSLTSVGEFLANEFSKRHGEPFGTATSNNVGQSGCLLQLSRSVAQSVGRSDYPTAETRKGLEVKYQRISTST